MKKIIVILLVCFMQKIIIAQQLKFSEFPTNIELKSAFISAGSGTIDLFKLMPKIIAKGDKAIPALQILLFTSPSENDRPEEIQRTSLYAAMALEGIGTKMAYSVLFKAVSMHRDPEVRGQALKAITQTFYQKALDDSIAPDKKVIHLLLCNADDITQVQYIHKSIAQIAREGLKNWFGLDLGDVVMAGQVVTVGSYTPKIPQSADRENWWKENNEKIRWNKEMGKFEVK